MHKHIPKKVSTHAFMFFAAVLLILLASLSFFTFWHQTTSYKEELIAKVIHELSIIFKKIDEECVIWGFEDQKNDIDFLNVGSFSGSVIGPMNLKYSQRWQGPYLEENPTIQQKFYEVIRTHKGYFIVPPEGIKIHGKIIGKDIKFTEDTDVESMIMSGVLKKGDHALAARITVQGK